MQMLKKYALPISYIIIGVLAGINIGLIVSYWDSIKITCNIRLADIIHITVIILIAIFVSYVVSTKINYNVKRKEILSDIISDLQSKLGDIIKTAYDYMHEANKTKEIEINRLFKQSSNLLGTLHHIKKSNSELIIDKSLHAAFLAFKKALTDTPFGQKKPKYSEEIINQIHSKYVLISSKLNECKLHLYD